MAENEDLDLMGKHSGRWRILCRKIQEGGPETEIAERALRCLVKTLKNVCGDLPLADLLSTAADERGDVETIIRSCRKHHEFAELFGLEAHRGLDRQTIAEHFVLNILDRFFDQIRHKVVGNSPSVPDFAHFDEAHKRWMVRLEEPIRRISIRLAKSPGKPPRMPRMSAAEKARTQRELQKLSLLPFRSGTKG